MLGTEEGKTVVGGAVRMQFVILVIGAVMVTLVIMTTFYSRFIGRYEKSYNTDSYVMWDDLMRNNPVPVRSVYTTLQDSSDKDFYFIAITYKKEGSMRTDCYTNNESLDASVDDRAQFIEQMNQQFDVSLTEGNLHTKSGMVSEIRSILHSFSDKECEVYYNPQHETADNFFPPYLYIVVRDDLIVGM